MCLPAGWGERFYWTPGQSRACRTFLEIPFRGHHLLVCLGRTFADVPLKWPQEGDSGGKNSCRSKSLFNVQHNRHQWRNQIAELFIEEKNYVKALQFIQAEKMFYEVALIELTALQGAAGAQDSPASLGSAAWDRPEEELSELASQAQDYERLAQLCIMSKRPHLALEYSGKATKIRQKAFGNDHPITARSLELLASVYAEIGKTEYSDSLGQCVTALSKSMTPTEAFSHASRSTASSHRERRSDVRHHHRKEPHPLPEVPMTKITTCKFPPSILKRSNLCGSDSEATHRRRSERRVRFREPENIVHGYDASPGRPHLAPLACLFLLLSVLGVMLYCMGRRRPLRTCEELEAILAVCVLQVKQLVWGCWVWLTMQ
nr:uncharacterized protein LOC111838917 isoform X10 [Paramormyrops kingsleyae]